MLLIMVPVLVPAVKRQFKKPEFDDEYMFDDFICNDLFATDIFEMLDPVDKQIELGTDKYPGFLIRRSSDDVEFLISTKYIDTIREDDLQWCTQDQFKHYKLIGKLPFYVIIGISGTCYFPEKIFMIPLGQLDSNTVRLSHIQLFTVEFGHKINFPDQ